MTLRSHHAKLIGAAGAAALAVGVVAGPAVAVGPLTATATYSCLNTLVSANVNLSFAEPVSTTMVAGQKVNLPGTASVTLDAGATHLMLNTLHWDSFDGNVVAPVPTNTLGMSLTVPTTLVGTPPGQDGTTTTATATGNAILDYATAGTKTITAGNFTANLQGFKSGSKVGTPAAVSCVAPTDGSTVLKDAGSAPVTITVTKDKSKTTASAKYAASKHTVTATAKVAGATYKLVGSGKVTFTLKKGTHKVGSVVKSLSKKGVATAAFKNVKAKGKYTLTASYAGNGGLNKSSGKTTFTVR